MAMVNTRSIALPGIVAAAVLCGVLAGGPARAGEASVCAAGPGDYAFACTGSPNDWATLTLEEGSQSVKLSDGGFQGWVSTEAFNFTGPDVVNTNYIVGVYNGSTHNNFFVFNL